MAYISPEVGVEFHPPNNFQAKETIHMRAECFDRQLNMS